MSGGDTRSAVRADPTDQASCRRLEACAIDRARRTQRGFPGALKEGTAGHACMPNPTWTCPIPLKRQVICAVRGEMSFVFFPPTVVARFQINAREMG